MNKTLQNKVAIVTGGSSGIGKATAILLARESWLASPKSSFVTGSYYLIDGGYLTQ